MRTKNFIVYYRKEKSPPDPFLAFGKKRNVYHSLFLAGFQRKHAMFISSGEDAYLGNGRFKNLLQYDGEKFIPYVGEIMADAIFDRSGGMKFPSDELDGKVLNMISFKKLCSDKFATFECIGEWMAQTYLIDNSKKLKECLKNFSDDDIIVLKPIDGMQGKNILIQAVSDFMNIELKKGKYVLQEFVDTSCGIEGVVSGRHDLRVIIVNGKTVLCHVRTPKEGGYLANVALGGSIAEVPLKKIPSAVVDVVKSIQQIIDVKFNIPVYSVDFGVSNGRPYIFEINDQIGFPDDSMENRDKFINGIIDSLERISEKV